MYRTRLLCALLALLLISTFASLCHGQSIDAVIKSFDIKGPYEDALLGHADNIEAYLKSTGMKVEQENGKGLTLLDCAIIGRQLEVVKVLVDRFHAEINSNNSKGLLPIHYAAAGNAVEIIKYLKEKGADVNQPTQGSIKDTPLIIAASRGYVQTVRVLLECGADPELTNNNNQTACKLAMNLLSIFEIKDEQERDDMLKQTKIPILQYRTPLEMQDLLTEVIELLKHAERSYVSTDYP